MKEKDKKAFFINKENWTRVALKDYPERGVIVDDLHFDSEKIAHVLDFGGLWICELMDGNYYGIVDRTYYQWTDFEAIAKHLYNYVGNEIKVVQLTNGDVIVDNVFSSPTIKGKPIDAIEESYFLALKRKDQRAIWNAFKYDVWGNPELTFNDKGEPNPPGG